MNKQEIVEQYVEKAAASGIDPVEARQEAEAMWDLLHGLHQPKRAPLVSPLAAQVFLPKKRG